ncbi:MAG TPA: cbb3-type cytochrome c oxidase subunit II [Chloroflexia bacterium]|nr:cbb3-type cytochrome c oxidase subunit II [Chloroflexia bacterium]
MHQQDGAVFRMDGKTVFLGALTVFSSIMFVVIALPFLTFNPPRSADARPLSKQEERGRVLYASNGCNYCHSQYIRPQDWTAVNSFRTVGRVAQAGDYFYQETLLLGTERTGPDLSQEGGSHTDEWHLAHFYNPRWTYPKSIMPQFSFYYETSSTGAISQKGEIEDLIAYVQSLGGQAGVERAARQRALKARLLEERAKGNEAVIHEWFQPTWRNVRNPMPASIRSLSHGKQVFTTNCIGCHGLTGDGKGPATYFISNPAPRNFTDASVQLYFSDGELYDAILFGVDGTAMPSWGDILTVNDIWDTVNFIRTIPNGGLTRDDLDPSMMISPPDVRPIDVAPLPTANIPGNVPVVTPEGGQGETGDATPAAVPTNATAVPTARSETGPGSGAPPQPGASPATGLPTALP